MSLDSASVGKFLKRNLLRREIVRTKKITPADWWFNSFETLNRQVRLKQSTEN